MKTIKFPIKSSIYGFFPYEDDYNKILTQHIKTLLMTRYGEIPMQNDYGIKYEEVFGSSKMDSLFLFKKHIEDQIIRFCPECSVESVKATIDNNLLNIELVYKINKTNEYETLMMQVEG